MQSTDPVVVESQALVVDVFKSLREDLLKAYGNVEHVRKADRSPVTVWDVKVEDSLRAALKATFPELGFRGEETGAHGNATTYWLVDPIDGTSSFIRGLPFCVNMAALVHEDEVLASVIYDFVKDELYMARKGEGAFKDGQRLHVNTTRHAGGWMAYTFSQKRFELARQAFDEIGVKLKLPIGASGNAYCLLAEGRIDAIVGLGSPAQVHDNAPGMLLCEEAGAHILAHDDKEGIYRELFTIGSPQLVKAVEHSGFF